VAFRSRVMLAKLNIVCPNEHFEWNKSKNVCIKNILRARALHLPILSLHQFTEMKSAAAEV
jgi:hypothetical protein